MLDFHLRASCCDSSLLPGSSLFPSRERITISLVFHGLTYNMLEHYWSCGIFSMQLQSFLREQLTDCIGFERKLRYELL